MAIKHSKVSLIADGADSTVVRPSDWNADHAVDDASLSIAATAGLQAALDSKSDTSHNHTETFALAASDETTALTVGTGKLTFRMPYAFTLTGIKASVNTAPTGASLVVDVNEGGVSILSTPLSIDAGEKTSATAATPAVISDTALAADAEITIDIDQVGSTVAGAGLKIYLIGNQ